MEILVAHGKNFKEPGDGPQGQENEKPGEKYRPDGSRGGQEGHRQDEQGAGDGEEKQGLFLAHQEQINAQVAQKQDYQTGVAALCGEKKPQEIAETGD